MNAFGTADGLRNIQHWTPAGRLTTHYLEKRLGELRSGGIEPAADTPIFTSAATAQLKPVKAQYLTQKIHRILTRLGIAGQGQGTGSGTRYEKRGRDFRKFGAVGYRSVGSMRKSYATSWVRRRIHTPAGITGMVSS